MTPGEERGSASVLVLGLLAVLSLAGATSVSLALVTVARHQAEAAADLAALAAAVDSLEGQDRACGRAREIAVANGGRLASCRLEAGSAVVVVEVRPPGRLALLGPARATARAGPG